jgi:DNA-directed RNA polymerase specialized sigma24 family protein
VYKGEGCDHGTHPEYQYVASRLESLAATRRRVGEACFLHGLSIREASRTLGLTYYVVRRHRQAIVTCVEAILHQPAMAM